MIVRLSVVGCLERNSDIVAQCVGTKCPKGGVLICCMPVGTGCARCCVFGCVREKAPSREMNTTHKTS